MNRKTSLNYLIILLLAMTWATSLAAEKKDMPKEDVIEVPAIIKRICFTPQTLRLPPHSSPSNSRSALAILMHVSEDGISP